VALVLSSQLSEGVAGVCIAKVVVLAALGFLGAVLGVGGEMV